MHTLVAKRVAFFLKFILYLSDFIIPLMFFYIIAYGFMMKINVYEEFLKGVKDGFLTVYSIAPTLVGLFLAVSVIRNSGLLNLIGDGLKPMAGVLNIPAPMLPVILVRMFSSSAATGLVLDIFKEFGPDSYVGRAVSIVMSCTETIFYTMSVYFMAAKVTKTRYVLAGGLVTTLVSVVASVLLARGM